MDRRIVVLGAGESGTGAAVLAKKQGFDIFVSDAGKIKDGDALEIDMVQGVIHNLTSGEPYKTTPLPGFLREIVEAGGLVEYTRRQASRRVEA
jgi:3-isopropylmalate dehydratase small subunit